MTDTPTRPLKLLYFAWVREKIGIAQEDVACPADIQTVADLIEWQKLRGDEYAAAFERAGVIRTAIDKTHARADQSITGAREIAFFPPVTGG